MMLVSSGWSFNKLMQEKEKYRGFKRNRGEANFVRPKESWKQQSLHLNPQIFISRALKEAWQRGSKLFRLCA